MIRVYQGKWPESFFNEWIENKNLEYINREDSTLFREYSHYYNDKCVFCETPLSITELMVGYYRPVDGALNVINGEYSDEHYRWLDNEWSNTLILCVECNRSKSNRFPVEGDFCSLEMKETDLVKEKRLLVNPFRDYPEKHFLYDEEGMIIPKTTKGEVTVEILNLNRESLINGRKKALLKFNEICHLFNDNNHDVELLEEIVNQVRQEAPFAGIKRYSLFNMIADNKIPYIDDFLPYLNKINGRNPISRDDIHNKIAKEKYLNKTKTKDYYNVSNDNDLRKYFSKQRYIESVEVTNFKGLKYVKLDLRLSQSKDAPWLILLGENGIGKTSVLQAISIGLMGELKRKEVIRKEANNFIYKQQNEGNIKIKLTGMVDPIIIEYSNDSHLFRGRNHIDPRVLILSYGSTRLLPTQDRPDNYKPSWARVENLFDPFVPLVDVESYLISLQRDDFNKVKSAIENLFLEKVEITRAHDNKELKFNFFNKQINLEDLSDGYKAIIALATDIMMVMKNRWRSYDAEGIVLIDELDAHLHPRWNIEIVRRLRKAFPKIQFIATSHNPLTLRGLLKNEVAVMFEDDNKETLVIQDLPAQKGMRIEEILTSKFFGLYDTLPELNLYFQEYYKLLAHPSPNTEQAERIDELEDYLSEYNKLGLTKRDQLFYKAIDMYLAREKEENEELNISSFTQDIDNTINSLRRIYRK